MVIVNPEQEAYEDLQKKFAEAQSAGSIGPNEKFDPKRVKGIKAGENNEFRLVYTTTEGETDKRIRFSFRFRPCL